MARLLNRVISQMFIRLGVLGQYRTIVDVWVCYCETAQTRSNIGFDVGNTSNLLHIASNRGGTGASDHVRNIERDKREFGRGRLARI